MPCQNLPGASGTANPCYNVAVTMRKIERDQGHGVKIEKNEPADFLFRLKSASLNLIFEAESAIKPTRNSTLQNCKEATPTMPLDIFSGATTHHLLVDQSYHAAGTSVFWSGSFDTQMLNHNT